MVATGRPLRIMVVSETALAAVNGVTNCVLRTVRHLRHAGHDVLVLAPGPGPTPRHQRLAGATLRLVRSAPLPIYPSFRVGLATPREATQILRAYQPDLVHLASPIVLGDSVAVAAHRLGIPAVAVFQTDVAGFARRYHLGALSPLIWRKLRRLHRAVDLTLAPSTHTVRLLHSHRIGPLALWRRGVDTTQFNPAHRCDRLRHALAPHGETLVGYVGRLAPDKRVQLLGRIADLPGTRLVIVGDGPSASKLRRTLPQAAFTGLTVGARLSALVASLDVFVHTGADDTFCQAAQEALAAGVPVVAPAVGGPVDLIDHGHNGLLYPPDDVTSLRAAVHRLSHDATLRCAMGEHARQSVHAFTWTAIGNELLAHYADVLATTQPAGGSRVRPNLPLTAAG